MTQASEGLRQPAERPTVSNALTVATTPTVA